MSSRRRRNTGARSAPSSVQLWKLTSATSFGLDPRRRRIELRLFGERARRSRCSGSSALLHLRQRALVEARADVRRVAQLALVPVADQERAERRARALALRVAADDEIRALRRLHLEPRRRAPAGLVAAFLALADHALEAARERRGLQRDAVVRGVHELHERRRQQALREIAPPVRVRRLCADRCRRSAAGRSRRRPRAASGRRRRSRAPSSAARDPAARANDGLPPASNATSSPSRIMPSTACLRELRGEPRKLSRELEPAARAQPHAVLVDEREHAIAVELGLPHPVRRD